MSQNNRIGGHIGSYHTHSLEEACEGIAAAGFRFVELSAVRGWNEHVPLEADAKTLSAIQRLLNRTGLIAMSLSGHSDLTSATGLADGKKALDLCERLGIDIMNTAIGGHTSEGEDEASFMSNIHTLADYAAERDIVLGIEVHGEITPNGKRAMQMKRKINRKNVRINYDTANVEFYSGDRAVDDLGSCGKGLVHVHLKDKLGEKGEWNFPPIGKGHVDFKRVLKILKAGKYAGPMSVEIEFKDGVWPPLKTVNASMKYSFKTLSALGYL
jgi:sugar phosphate isomerase/epimerase